MSKLPPVVLAWIIIMASGVSPALAQQQTIEFTPFIGAFVPVNSAIDDRDVELRFDHSASLALGGRMALWIEDALALEGAFAHLPSDVSDQTFGPDARIWAASGRLLYRLDGPTDDVRLHLGAGFAVIGHEGDAYASFGGTTDLGVVLDVGARYRLGPRLALRFDLEDHLSEASFTPNAVLETDSRLQNDLVISVGLATILTGR